MWRKGFAIAFAIGLGLVATAEEPTSEAATEPPPIGAFTDESEFGFVSISPDGKHLAQYMRVDGEGRFQVLTYPERENPSSTSTSASASKSATIESGSRTLACSPRRAAIRIRRGFPRPKPASSTRWTSRPARCARSATAPPASPPARRPRPHPHRSASPRRRSRRHTGSTSTPATPAASPAAPSRTGNLLVEQAAAA